MYKGVEHLRSPAKYYQKLKSKRKLKGKRFFKDYYLIFFKDYYIDFTILNYLYLKK